MTRYVEGMAKSTIPAKVTTMTVRSSRTGKVVTVKGAGALKGSGFSIARGIDLTKPIAKQALKGKPAAKQPAAG